MGEKGVRKELIEEMRGRIRWMGIEGKMKGDSWRGLSYGNRYRK